MTKMKVPVILNYVSNGVLFSKYTSRLPAWMEGAEIEAE